MTARGNKPSDTTLDQVDSKPSSSQRGRPRIYPKDETATERVNRSVQNLLAKGGARRTFRLSPAANAALGKLREDMGKNNDTAVIEEVLIKAARALEKAQKASGSKK